MSFINLTSIFSIFSNSLKIVLYLRAPFIHRLYWYPGLDPKSKSATRIRNSRRKCSVRKGVLRNSQENTCSRISFLIKLQALAWSLAWNFIKKGILAQVFSCELFKVSKNNFLQKTSGWLVLKDLQVFSV